MSNGEGYEVPDLGIRIKVTKARGPKCPRCWNHDENIGKPGHHHELCDRCARVLSERVAKGN